MSRCASAPLRLSLLTLGLLGSVEDLSPAFAGNVTDASIPAKLDLGASAPGSLPPLGNVSGIGKGPGGMQPDRIVKIVQSSRNDRRDTLRGKKKTNDALDRLGRAVVLVVTPTQLGSATLIDANGTFVTAWHIVGGLDKVGVIFMPRNHDRRATEADAVQASVTASSQTTDLALIRLDHPEKAGSPVRLAPANGTPTGAPLQILGHPYGEIWTHTQGTLKSTTAAFSWKSGDGTAHVADVISFSSTSITGNAGGPVLDSRDRLLAIDAMRTDDTALTSLGVSVSEVRHLRGAPARQAMYATRPSAAVKACEPARLETRRTKLDDGTVHVLDLNCNGHADAMLLVPDNPKAADYLTNDANENGVTDSIYFDFDRDGKFDEVRFDTNEDGKADMVGSNLDAQLVPQTTRVLGE